MIDFAKLRDPTWKAELRAKEEAKQAELKAKETQQRAVVRICQDHWQELASNERSLVVSCLHKLNTVGVFSEKQEAWVGSIAKRFVSAK